MCSDGEATPGAGVWRKKEIVREDGIARLQMVDTGHIEGEGRKGSCRSWEVVEW